MGKRIALALLLSLSASTLFAGENNKLECYKQYKKNLGALYLEGVDLMFETAQKRDRYIDQALSPEKYVTRGALIAKEAKIQLKKSLGKNQAYLRESLAEASVIEAQLKECLEN